MKFTLDVMMSNSEGALERLLGRLRQRSFNVCSLNANVTSNMARMELRITVDSPRNIELAVKQLNKLIDVEGVEVVRAEEHIHINQHANHHHHEHRPRAHYGQHHSHETSHVPALDRLFEYSTSQIGL